MTLSAEERSWLAGLPVLRIGIDPTAAPVSQIGRNGDAEGLAIDYLLEATQALGLRTEIAHTADWRDTVRLATAGDIDLLPAASQSNLALDRRFRFTAPYLQLPVVIVTRESGLSIAGTDDLDGHRIAANLAQGAVAATVAPLSSVDIMPVSTTAEGLAAVASGRVDAYVGDIATAEVLIRRDYPARLRIAAPTGGQAGISMAVDQRFAALVPLLDRVIAHMPERRGMAIRNTWLRSDYIWGGSWRDIARKVGPAAIVVLALLFLVSHAYLRLRRETRRRERTEEQLADVTRHMPAVVYRFRYHGDGRIAFLYVGGNPEPIFGVPADTFLHDERRAFATIDGRDQAALMDEVVRAASSLTPIHAEMRIRGVSPERWVASHAVPRRVGDIVEFTGYWIDISERQSQAAQLAVARDAAESATQAKSRFLATMSHEIRTPMHGVIGMLEMLGTTSLDPTQHRLLRTAETSAGALLQILDDVLDFSRIEAGQLAVERGPVDLRELTAAVLELFAWQADEKGLAIACRIDERLALHVLTDGARLRQVLLNLVSNAIKFTARGKVTVALDVLDDGSERQQLRIAVADTGVGISRDDLGRLFSPFTQAETSIAQRFGGSGLGLAISRQLVALLGGAIAMRSEPGVGTRVTVDLDLPVVSGPATDNATVAVRATPTDTVLDVLVAEDNPTNRELVAAQLERLGHRYTVVDDGEQALTAAMERPFDVVLTDLQMPGRDGYALARALRQRAITWPIVAMTANALPGERERCLAAGMDGFLTKPTRLDALREALSAVAPVDLLWDIDALQENFGSLAGLPAMVDRFASSMRSDLDSATHLLTAEDAAAWSHRIGGGLRVFGPSRMAAMLERFEADLRGEDAAGALRRLPSLLNALEGHVTRMVDAARELAAN
ncbi:MAG TPA: ATP-binding protein [Luteibacter sp.]|uniref:ATP-binding protein n=1 Tax=Luteibacter sp. TaxID=1886636 RepID=UPI002C3546D7|nr:ATP-binding protein [Luteibacter sp.]HVI54613.1 ATP-binding protein [Luteibacter sp.]